MKLKSSIQFPRYIDKPKMIGIFEMDEILVGLFVFFLIFLFGFFMGYQSGVSTPLALFGLVLTSYIIKKYKANYSDNFLYHLSYRNGFYHPVLNNVKMKKRFDIKNGAKIIPTGYINYFYE